MTTKLHITKGIFGGALLVTTAVSEAREIEWIIQGELSFGGDEIAEVRFTDGSSETLYGGGTFLIGGGILVDTLSGSSIYQTQLTINYKFDSSNASNGDLSWDRYPLELIQFYNLDQWRFGGGLTYHLSPSISGSGFASDIDASFDDALGFVAEIDYLFNNQGFIGGRITNIEYQDEYSNTIDGNSIGLVFGAHF